MHKDAGVLQNPCPICDRPLSVGRGRSLRTQKAVLACLAHFRNKPQEYFICLSVDSGQRLITWRVVTMGTLTASLAHPREVFKGAIADNAASVIIAHNHPSGDPTPSGQDISTTQQLVAAGQILGIELQDHVVLTARRHYSFKAHYLL